MPHSKTPGGSGASEKFMKQQAESNRPLPSLPFPSLPFLPSTSSILTHAYPEHGEGASNAGGHTEAKAPGEAPVCLNFSPLP